MQISFAILAANFLAAEIIVKVVSGPADGSNCATNGKSLVSGAVYINGVSFAGLKVGRAYCHVAKGFSRSMFDDDITCRIFNRNYGAGWVGGSEVDAGAIHAGVGPQSFGHAARANCDDGTTSLGDGDTGVEGAVAIVGWAIDDDGAAGKVDVAVTVHTIAAGVNVDVATVDS